MVSFGNSSDSSQSSTHQSVWGAQTPYLQQLYSQGNELLQSQGGISDYSSNLINKYMPGAQDVVNNNLDTSYLDSIMSGTNLGMRTLSGLMSPQGNPYLDDQIINMKKGIADNMRIFGLSDSADSAISAGQFGNDRHGVSDFLVQREAMKNASDAETAMRMQAYGTDQANAFNAANAYTNNIYNAGSQRAIAGNNYLDNVEAVHNLGLNPYTSAWMPMINQANIVGAPTTLSNSSSYGSGRSINLGFGS